MGNLQATAKKAAGTTALVLVTIFLLRKVTFTRSIVDRAISG